MIFLLPESKARRQALSVSLSLWYVQKHARTPFDIWTQSDFIGRRCDGPELSASLLSARLDDKLFMCPQAFVEQ